MYVSGDGMPSGGSLLRREMCIRDRDVTNYSLTYKMAGYVNHMSPYDHYQDLKRIIGEMCIRDRC